jgi:hypothetical protein
MHSYGSELQFVTRRANKFLEVEESLPEASPQLNFQLESAETKLAAHHRMDDLLSYLGPYNPRPLPLDADDVVWLFDNTAFIEDAEDTWKAEFVTAVFASKACTSIVDAVKVVADKLGFVEGDAELKIIEERIRPFLMVIQPGRLVVTDFDGREEIELGPGGRNGISSNVKDVAYKRIGSVAHSLPRLPAGNKAAVKASTMKTVFAGPEGWAVISDVDDTIKITQTSDPIGILKSTFVVRFESCAPAVSPPRVAQHVD